MRVAVLFIAACALQGCTALGAGFTAEFNRQDRADAQVDLDARPPAPGDALVLHLAGGQTVRSLFVSVSPDSVWLSDGAVARADVHHAERPWRRRNVIQAGLIGAAADVAFLGWLFYALQDLHVPLDIRL